MIRRRGPRAARAFQRFASPQARQVRRADFRTKAALGLRFTSVLRFRSS